MSSSSIGHHVPFQINGLVIRNYIKNLILIFKLTYNSRFEPKMLQTFSKSFKRIKIT